MTRLFEAKPYIVAEVGSNWATREDAIASVGAAKAAGADCVKFQAFTYADLYGQPRPKMDPKLQAITDLTMRYWGADPAKYESGEAYHELPLAWLPALKEKADACGIDFACTAFSPELVAAVDPYVAWHKVASSDATWPQLLHAVAITGKPVVLSAGAKSLTDLQYALSTLGHDVQTVVLYCVAAYPALHVDIAVMEMLRAQVACYAVGFSDHSPGISQAIEAHRRGAVVIEKHFTAFPELDTPDRPHSLDPGEFRTMVEHIRGVRQPAIGPTAEERDMLLRHNRRLIATRDMAPGEVLTYGYNFGAYRSLRDDTRGLSPFAWQQVEGGIVLAPIARGEAIGPGDFA